MRRLASLFAAVLLLAGCGAGGAYRDTSVPISSAAAFDPERYTGLWYEIARFPVPFQSGCVVATARYGALPDGRLSVVNTCRDGSPDGSVRQIQGDARITGPGRLSVGFTTVPLVRAPY